MIHVLLTALARGPGLGKSPGLAAEQRRLVMRHQEYTEVCGGIHIYGKGHK